MKKCIECGAGMEGKRHDAVYCSAKCRSRAYRKGNRSSLNGTGNGYERLPALDASSSFIISELERERDRQERKLIETESERKALEKRNAELRDELTNLKNDYRIESIERKNSGPKGLGGFIEKSEPILEKLAPAINAWVANMMKNGPQGQLPQQEGDPFVRAFGDWFPTLPEDLRKLWFENIIGPISKLSENEQKIILQQLKNLITDGSTVRNTG